MSYESIRLFQKDQWVQDLYDRAFPENERSDLEPLYRADQDVGMLMLVLKDGKKAGFYCTLRCLGICHVIYFAVAEELRDHGIGREILRHIVSQYPGERIIVDIERENAAVANDMQRIERKQFYLRNGFKETDVKYRWQKEDYEILSHGGNVTYQEWGRFWQYIDHFDKRLLY